MGIIFNISGHFFTEENAKISVLDRGFLMGDAVFETLRTYGGHPFMLPDHIDRLERSANFIELALPIAKKEIGDIISESCQRSENSESAIRVVVTRGTGSLALDFPTNTKPNLIIIAFPLQPFPAEIYEKGVAISIVSIRKSSEHALNPRIKSTNYLINMMAKREATLKRAFEAVLLNERGEVAECAQSNIFAVLNNTILTPPLSAGILDGITRKVVITLAREKQFLCLEQKLTPSNLYEAGELFITSTRKGIVPVVQCDGQTIGNGKMGPVTRALTQALETFAKSAG